MLCACGVHLRIMVSRCLTPCLGTMTLVPLTCLSGIMLSSQVVGVGGLGGQVRVITCSKSLLFKPTGLDLTALTLS